MFFFSWHVEDMDLHSINYLHYGAPKTWYVVPPKYGHLMEKAARELFPNVASWCSNFMRHKTCLISPQQLDKYGIPYTKVVQVGVTTPTLRIFNKIRLFLHIYTFKKTHKLRLNQVFSTQKIAFLFHITPRG